LEASLFFLGPNLLPRLTSFSGENFGTGRLSSLKQAEKLYSYSGSELKV